LPFDDLGRDVRAEVERLRVDRLVLLLDAYRERRVHVILELMIGRLQSERLIGDWDIGDWSIH
jgi:hypothetical protein